jgi:Mn-dependent DtxR family transcriptional regulator
MSKLTKSQENYIKIIYELSLHGDGVHVTDIAAKLGVAKASASVAVKALQKQELVRRDIGRLVYLTDEGKKQAAHIEDKFLLIYKFLTDTLHIDWQTAHTDACALEHLMSQETLCAICRFMNSRACNNGCAVSRKVAGI